MSRRGYATMSLVALLMAVSTPGMAGQADDQKVGTRHQVDPSGSRSELMETAELVVPLYFAGSEHEIGHEFDSLHDFEGDGDLDLYTPEGVILNENGAFGSFISHGIQWPDQREPIGADLDGDGYADFIQDRWDGIWIALNNGDGTIGAETFLADPGDDLEFVGELNSTPGVELAFHVDGDTVFYTYEAGSMVVWETIESHEVRNVSIGDFNGDGLNDMVTGWTGWNYLEYFIQNNDGFHLSTSIEFEYSEDFEYLGVVDIDSDGLDELTLLVTSFSSTADYLIWWELGPEEAYLGEPEGSFEFEHGENLSLATIADVDGDGHVDIVQSRLIHVGLGSSWLTMPGLTEYSETILAVEDWDGDGVLDLFYGLDPTYVAYGIDPVEAFTDPGTFSGRVEDESGVGLSNICVEVLVAYSTLDLPTLTSTVTDGNGDYSVEAPVGWYHLLFWDCEGHLVEDPRWAYEYEFNANQALPVNPRPVNVGATRVTNPVLRSGGAAVGLVWDTQLWAGIEGMDVFLAVDRLESGSGRHWWDLFYSGTDDEGIWAFWGLRPDIGIYGVRYEHPEGLYETLWWHDQPYSRAGRFQVAANEWKNDIIEEMAPVFFDIYDSSFIPDIIWAADSGVTAGCFDEYHFCPTDPVTRAQMATFLGRALDFDHSHTQYFGDVAGGVHFVWVNALREAGVTLGCNAEGTLYCPNDNVTRAQMASFMVRALDLPPTDVDYFSDDDGSTHEAAINAFREAEVTFGCGLNAFCPTELVTREQMSAFLQRALNVEG